MIQLFVTVQQVFMVLNAIRRAIVPIKKPTNVAEFGPAHPWSL